MLRYLRIQASTMAHNYAQQMLDHGAYTFHPQTYRDEGLPQQAPADIVDLLEHTELYEE